MAAASSEPSSIPPLRHFCYCVSLLNGVRVISAVSLVYGVSFMILGSEVANGEGLTDVIEACCQITGILFLTWFLTLLLLLSLNITIPRKLAVWIGSVLIIWLMVLFVSCITLFSIHGFHDDFESISIIITIMVCFIACIVTMYGVCVLRSYIYQLMEEAQNGIRSESELSDLHAQLMQPSTAQSFYPSVSQKSSYTSVSSRSKKKTPSKYAYLPNRLQQGEKAVDNTEKVNREPKRERMNMAQPTTVVQNIFIKEKFPEIFEGQKMVEYFKHFKNSPSKSQQTSPLSSDHKLKIAGASAINKHNTETHDKYKEDLTPVTELRQLHSPRTTIKGHNTETHVTFREDLTSITDQKQFHSPPSSIKGFHSPPSAMKRYNTETRVKSQEDLTPVTDRRQFHSPPTAIRGHNSETHNKFKEDSTSVTDWRQFHSPPTAIKGHTSETHDKFQEDLTSVTSRRQFPSPPSAIKGHNSETHDKFQEDLTSVTDRRQFHSPSKIKKDIAKTYLLEEEKPHGGGN